MAILNPGKIGIGAWEGGDPQNPSANGVVYAGIKAIGLKNYYTWNPPKLIGDDGTITFYPGFFYPSSVTSANLALAKAANQLTITLNEPWHTDPGWIYTSPSAALDLWPQFLALGNRLATPSISGPNDGNDWLAQFMSGAASRGYRVDAINVHYYSSDGDINAFRNYLQSVHDLYNKPIIVGEWARYTNWGMASSPTNPQVSPAVQASWLQAGAQMMDTLDFVERWFWYAAGDGAGGNLYLGSAALNQDGSMTPVGAALYSLLNPGQTAPTSTTTLVAEFYKNGILVGTANKLPTGTLYPILSFANNSEAATANFGATPMAFLPNGVSSWDGSQIGTGVTPTAITLSTTDKASSVVLSNSNLTATQSGSSSGMVRGIKSGVADRYFEVKFGTIAAGAGNPGIGLANASQALTNSYPGNPNGVGWFASGYAEWPQSGAGNLFTTYVVGDVLGVLLKASSVQFYKNGTLVGTASALPAGQLYPIISLVNNTDSATVNFGATPLSFLPAGSASWDGSQTRTGGGTTTVGGFVCDGDSLTYGLGGGGVDPTTPYPTQLASLTGLSAINIGIGGKTLVAMDADYASHTAPNYSPTSANILVIEGGINDCYQGGTPSGTAAAIRSYCAKARATGYKVYIMTLTPSLGYGWSGSNESLRQAINTDRRTNWASYCDGLIDVAASSAMSDPMNSTYFQSDLLHWTTAGNAVVANLVKTAVLG
jgi:hypothetical protein